MSRYVVLISLWVAWCFLHSLLTTSTVIGFVQKRFKKAYRYYRIFYNVIALVTLIPVVVYSSSIQCLPVFRWEGPFRIVQGLLVISALLFLSAIPDDTIWPSFSESGKFAKIAHAAFYPTTAVWTQAASSEWSGILGTQVAFLLSGAEIWIWQQF